MSVSAAGGGDGEAAPIRAHLPFALTGKHRPLLYPSLVSARGTKLRCEGRVGRGFHARHALGGHGEQTSGATTGAGEREGKGGPGSEALRGGKSGQWLREECCRAGRLAGLELLGRR